jgi:hypothetical protein
MTNDLYIKKEMAKDHNFEIISEYMCKCKKCGKIYDARQSVRIIKHDSEHKWEEKKSVR